MKTNMLFLLVGLGFMACSTPKTSTGEAAIAKKGKLLLEENFVTPATYTKEAQPVKNGWKVKVGHSEWERISGGVATKWTTGHMPVLTYEGNYQDVVIELEYRFFAEEGKWATCRISATNPELNPRAYAVSVWANQDNKAREKGMVLEHDEWKPGVITTVENKPATWEPGKWYKISLEIVGNYARATCNGVTVYGTHEKFGMPKTHIYLGTGTAKHEIRNFRVFEAVKNPKWVVK
jgi:Domain of Unknown Function (DUF1080)